MNDWWMAALMAALVGIVVWLAFNLLRSQRTERKLKGTLSGHEKLVGAMHAVAPDASNLRDVLDGIVREIVIPDQLQLVRFGDEDVEVVYAYPDDAAAQMPLADRMWALVQSGHARYLTFSGVRTAAKTRRTGDEAIVVAIEGREADAALGAIYALMPPGDNVQGPLLQLLASAVGAAWSRAGRFEAALKAQTEAFAAEVYDDLYDAEYYAQLMAYQRIEQELRLAGQIQASFLPHVIPECPGWRLAVSLEPARQTSGDFYDLIELPDGRLGLVVADVADKGFGAALFMALTRTLIRTYTAQFPTEPARALAEANRRILCDTESDLFVTVFLGILDPGSGGLAYCNAGHNPPLLVRWRGHNGPEIEQLPRTALPLGVIADGEWSEDSVTIREGEMLVIYTDGVTEAQDEEQGFFGEARLVSRLQRLADLTPAAIVEDLIEAVHDFAGEAAQSDDMTLLVAKRDGADTAPVNVVDV